MARPWQRPKCRSDPALACRSVPKGKSTEEIIGILREAEVLIERRRNAPEHHKTAFLPRLPAAGTGGGLAVGLSARLRFAPAAELLATSGRVLA